MTEEPLHGYRVGTLYIPGRTSWPEHLEYNWRKGGHELRLFFSGLRRDEIEAVRHGPMELRLVVIQPVIFLCFRFAPVIDWSDAPYNYHMVPEQERTLPPRPEETTGAELVTILVDGDTGVIEGLRLTRLRRDFARKLHGAIREQAALPFDQATYDRELDRIRRRYSRADLARRAIAVHESLGGREIVG